MKKKLCLFESGSKFKNQRSEIKVWPKFFGVDESESIHGFSKFLSFNFWPRKDSNKEKESNTTLLLNSSEPYVKKQFKLHNDIS
jgi:hypothetical protein